MFSVRDMIREHGREVVEAAKDIYGKEYFLEALNNGGFYCEVEDARELARELYDNHSLAHLPSIVQDNIDWDGIVDDLQTNGEFYIVDKKDHSGVLVFLVI